MEAVMAKIRIWQFFLLILFCHPSVAEQQTLAQSPQWRALMHYQTSPYPLNNTQFSQIADSHFFLHPNGNRDPEAELRANLESLQAIKCRFPARAKWLANQTGQSISFENCQQLNLWLEQFSTDDIYLHFPASYLNNPSSVFGHTFLRLHKHGRSELLDPIINYAAISNTHNPLAYIGRGLTGAFPGIFALHPHYLKLREYTVAENREIWTYKINLSSAEINRFLLHFWEIKDRQFNYYFLNQNCSYQLLALLDVAIQDLSLVDEFHNVALPIDTIKYLYRYDRLILADFHPSFVDGFREQISNLSKQERQQIIDITQCPVSDIPTNIDSRVLQLSSDYMEYLVQQDLRPRACAHKKVAQLQQALKENLHRKITSPIPGKGPENSHAPTKLGIGYQSVSSALLNFRLGYHELLDPVLGFKPGQEISIADFTFDIERKHLSEYKLIGLRSLSVSDEFFQPLSWTFDISGQRFGELLDASMQHQVSLGLGKTVGLGNNLLFSMAETSVSYSQDTGTDLNVTPTIGLLYSGETISSLLSARIQQPLTDWDKTIFLAESTQTINLNNDLQVSISAQWIHQSTYKQGNITLFLNYLF